MANLEIDDDGEAFLNVYRVVGGQNGDNLPSDVMAAQAMLRYIMTYSDSKWATKPAPIVTGILNPDTQQLIFDFQQSVRTNPDIGYWVAKDGRVCRRKKDVKLLHKQQWTIAALNSQCEMIAAANRHSNILTTIWQDIYKRLFGNETAAHA